MERDILCCKLPNLSSVLDCIFTEHHAYMLVKILPSKLMKVLPLIGYHSWWNLRMEMGTLAPCIYNKYVFICLHDFFTYLF